MVATVSLLLQTQLVLFLLAALSGCDARRNRWHRRVLKSSFRFHFRLVRSSFKSITRSIDQKLKRKRLRRFLKKHPKASKEEIKRAKKKADCPAAFECSEEDLYRTPDGSCNNLDHPHWGAANQPFRRYLPPEYSDKESQPRLKGKKGPLPSAREVSRRFHTAGTEVVEDAGVTHMLMQWGQFLDHDIIFTPVQTERIGNDVKPYACCEDKLDSVTEDAVKAIYSYETCFPIPLLPTDPVFNGPTRKKKLNCLSFARSVQVENTDCEITPVEQLNQITAYIDASNVYGSSKEEQDSLREFNQGLMKCQRMPSRDGCPAADLLPSNVNTCGSTKCFKSGDFRVNEQVGLASIHTVWLRQHNAVARQLGAMNKAWRDDDEKVFQETRKIVGAMMQVITYNEFLPIVLGDEMKKYKLDSEDATPSKYQDNLLNDLLDLLAPKSKHRAIDATITNSFATAAFRFGHSQIRGATSLGDNVTIKLSDAFGDTAMMTKNHCVTRQWMRGLSEDKCLKVNRFLSPEVTDHLFEDADGNKLDLAALNIQRGRDHGLPGYNAWRKFCGLKAFQKFSDMTDHTSQEKELLSSLYDHPDDIDLFTAGISERPYNGGLVGPTFACILGRQFSALKHGDRFWYERTCESVRFTREQIEELRKVTFSRVMCDHTGITKIQPNSFRSTSDTNQIKDCEDLPKMDISKWKVL
ncbi:salivary peroxidase/catechol oxidase-like [Haliotis cracherodii]|uniref:salivary peroxidase/catechol oxidase-like n=1 Tax=Haliotis cracherodii TaxID=6455 RepID=UPI0039E81411